MNTREKKLLLVYLCIDLFMINLSMILVYLFKYDVIDWSGLIKVLPLFNASWLLTLLIFKRENLFLRDGFKNRERRQVLRFFIYLAIAAAIIVILNIDQLPRSFYVIGNLIFFILNYIFYYFVYAFLGYLRRKGRFVRKTLIIGAGRIGMTVTNFIEKNQDMGYSIVGYLDDDLSLAKNIPLLGSVDDLQQVYNRSPFQEIIVAIPLNHEEKISRILSIADYNGVRVRLIPDFYRLLKCDYSIDTKDKIPFINVRKIPLDNFNSRCCKRLFDIAFSMVALILISPVMALVALAIRIESKGSIFYEPVRLGRAGKEFKLYKFRSMSVCDSSLAGINSTQKDDERITRVGRFIRKYSLDELPQFLNVLRGDMSVVGPRPHRLWLNKDLQHKVHGYMMRHYVKPGITGWAQVNGWRGPTETRLQRYGRTLHDLWYIENWTFLLDLWIIFLTVFGVKTRKNAF